MAVSSAPAPAARIFRALLAVHPVYIDPLSSLAGGYMVNFTSYRKPGWNPDIDRTELDALHARYQSVTVIGAMQHMCQDMQIGLELGWGGLLEKVRHYRRVNPAARRLLRRPGGGGARRTGLDRPPTPRRPRRMAEENPADAGNLREIAAINQRLVTEPPRTLPRGLPVAAVVSAGGPYVRRQRRHGADGRAA